MIGHPAMLASAPPRRYSPAPKQALLAIATASVAALAGVCLPWPQAIAAITLSAMVAAIVGVASGLIPCNLG